MKRPINLESISPWQFFAIGVVFELGSALVVGIGVDAKQDAWLALLTAALAGFVMVWGFYYISNKYPDPGFYDILIQTFGQAAGKVLIMAYTVYFLYLASFVLRDFVAMMNATVLSRTPAFVIAVTLMALIVYVLHAGLEAMGRVSELFLFAILIFVFILILFSLFSRIVHPGNLRPIMADGLLPIIEAAFPRILGFPIGEVPLVMAVLVNSVNRPDQGSRAAAAALAVGTSLLLLSLLLQITVIGSEVMSRASFPLLNVARLISISHFLERLDAVVVFIMMLGIQMKIAVFILLSLRGLEMTFRLPYRAFIMPVCILVVFFSMVHAKNFPDHLLKGFWRLPVYFHMPMQVYIPAILFLLALWRHRRSQTRRSVNANIAAQGGGSAE